MKRSVLILCAALAVAQSSSAAQFKLPGHTFTVPDGFEIEQVAGPGLTDRPIVADFDEQGRLYVADSSGSNDKVDKQLAEKPHRIVRLEDIDGDGRFDKTTVFADKMMFPEGAMWFNGSLYVGAPPSIWKLTDTDGDGVADKREEWFQGKTLTGCANDMHGPYLGPDGWIYWCKGAFAKQTFERPGKAPFTTRAAHMFRCRPDGSGLEPVMTGGMDNPVEVAFTPGGERIFTTTFFQHPGGGQRDGLVHAIYGGVYGKDHDVLDDHPRTGDLMPVLTQLGPAAPCGLTRYASSIFGAEYQDNLFACLFNLHKVTRHVLKPQGATFQCIDSDFLVSDNPDFHPTDVLEDADGSLLVINTGGWYKICCPTSQLWKPDVLGAIYRIRRVGAPRIVDPRGLRIPWAKMASGELAKLLGDDRPAVRNRAIQELAKQGNEAVPALKTLLSPSTKKVRGGGLDAVLTQTASVESRRNALWTLARIDAPSAREAIRLTLTDQDDRVRQVALHTVSVWRDAAALPQLLSVLSAGSAEVQRVAAEALGRIGDKSAVPALLKAASTQQDRVLEHSLTFALIEIADPAGTAVGLRAVSPHTQRAALVALDQMRGGGLKPEQVTPLLASAEPALQQAASWIVGRHPDWGGALGGYFRDKLSAQNPTDADRAALQGQLAQFARSPSIQELLATSLSDTGLRRLSQLAVLRAISQAGLKEAPSAWLAGIARHLAGSDGELVRAAVAAARSFASVPEGGAALGAALWQVARSSSTPDEVRLDALAAIPGGLKAIEPELFTFLLSNLAPAKPVLLRSRAASVLAKAKLTPDQLLALADAIKSTGPLEVPKLLAAFESSTDETLGLKLVASLKESPALSSLRAEILKPRLTNFPASVQQEGERLMASLNVDAAKQKAHLDDLAASLKGGDIRRGQVIFNGAKAACSACHAIGYLGGNIGPDLTRIGQIRTERDMLEALVYPSASFVRSYEPMFVATKSGEDYSGVVRRDTSEEMVLATGPGTEVRIARGDITELRPGTVSVMPQGLDEQLNKQELADLLAFLKATRW